MICGAVLALREVGLSETDIKRLEAVALRDDVTAAVLHQLAHRRAYGFGGATETRTALVELVELLADGKAAAFKAAMTLHERYAVPAAAAFAKEGG